MEAEKRKRSEMRESEEKLATKKKKDEKEKEIATDAEVEEFFAILRRMQEAVKHFGEGWRTAVEMEPDAVAAVDDKDDQEVKIGEPAAAETEEAENGHVLDLNAVPEGESHVASA